MSSSDRNTQVPTEEEAERLYQASLHAQANPQAPAIPMDDAPSPTAAEMAKSGKSISSGSPVFDIYKSATYAPMDSAVARNRSHDDSTLYGIVDEEINAGNIDRGLWVKMFSEADGDELRTRARYLKARVDQLKTQGKRGSIPA